jgi:hypothetical protein
LRNERRSDRHAIGLGALERLGGPEAAAPILAAADIAPDLVRFAIDFAFGEVLSRPGLNLKTRELFVWDRDSMPSRGLTFTQEIRDAIDRRIDCCSSSDHGPSVPIRPVGMESALFSKTVVSALRLGAYEAVPDELRRFHARLP